MKLVFYWILATIMAIVVGIGCFGGPNYHSAHELESLSWKMSDPDRKIAKTLTHNKMSGVKCGYFRYKPLTKSKVGPYWLQCSEDAEFWYPHYTIDVFSYEMKEYNSKHKMFNELGIE